MTGNYDNVAPFYDRLSRLVFGKAIMQAQKYLLAWIPANSNVLIVGGGTGQILEEITCRHPSGLHITYVEISANMLALSRKRNVGSNRVQFIHQPIQEVSLQPVFDVVITPFLFDNFLPSTSEIVFNQLHAALKPGSHWLFADFHLSEQSTRGQKWLLKSMYFFFGFLCNVETRRLYDMRPFFTREVYTEIACKTFYKKFIRSMVYRKY